MPNFWLVLIILALATAGFILARQRVLGAAGGDARSLHSLPVFYGANAAIFTRGVLRRRG